MQAFSIDTAVITLILVTGALASGCATASAGGYNGTDASEHERLTLAQIRAANLPNAYELVFRLRRPWLRRDPVTGAEVAVYIAGRRIGGAERLRSIPAVDVAELHYLGHDEAAMRWGAAVDGSVIVVVRR